MCVHPPGDSIGDELVRTALPWRDCPSLLKLWPTSGTHFLDLGANIAPCAFYMLQHTRAIVDAVEPNPANLALIRESMQRMGYDTKRLRVHGTAVGDVAANSTLGDVAANSTLGDGDPSVAAIGKPGIAVQLARLDDLFNSTFDLVKMDIEGYECHALCGAPLLLAQGHMPRFQFELNYPELNHQGCPEKTLLALFDAAGYTTRVRLDEYFTGGDWAATAIQTHRFDAARFERLCLVKRDDVMRIGLLWWLALVVGFFLAVLALRWRSVRMGV